MSNKLKTPSQIYVSPGNVIVDKKWRDTTVLSELMKKFNKTLIDDLGVYDFYVADTKPVVYIPEAQLITYVNVDKYNSCVKGTIFIGDRNTVTVEYYSKLQDTMAVKQNFTLLPVGNISELATLLYQISVVEGNRTPQNQFKRKPECGMEVQVNLLSCIPCLGKCKAQKLLAKFGSVKSIAACTTEQLSEAVGFATALQVYKFFNSQ